MYYSTTVLEGALWYFGLCRCNAAAPATAVHEAPGDDGGRTEEAPSYLSPRSDVFMAPAIIAIVA